MPEGTGQPQRYCRNCGAEVRAGTQFCVSCGVRLNSEPSTEPSSSDEAHSVPTPPTPSRSLVDTLREATLGLTRRLSNASSGSGGENLSGLPNRIINWFRDLPSTPKLIIVGIVLLLVLVFLSPLAFIAAAVLLGVSVLILIYRVYERGSVKGWGIVAVASLISLFVFGGISNSIYGIGSNNPPSSTDGSTEDWSVCTAPPQGIQKQFLAKHNNVVHTVTIINERDGNGKDNTSVVGSVMLSEPNTGEEYWSDLTGTVKCGKFNLRAEKDPFSYSGEIKFNKVTGKNELHLTFDESGIKKVFKEADSKDILREFARIRNQK